MLETDVDLTLEEKILIPAESLPKGGAVLLCNQPKFVQSVCVCVCICMEGAGGLLPIIILKLHRVILHYWRVAKPQFPPSLVLS